jgi:hypothetical protein
MKRGSKAQISNIFGTAFRAKVKFPGLYERDVQLMKRQDVHATTVINPAATTVTTYTNLTLTLELLLLLPPQLL